MGCPCLPSTYNPQHGRCGLVSWQPLRLIASFRNMKKPAFIRTIDAIFCCIIIIGGMSLMASGRSDYKGVHEEGSHVRVMGGLLFLSGCYLLFTTLALGVRPPDK